MTQAIMLLVQVEEGEAGGVRLSLRSQELLLGEREVCVVFMITISIIILVFLKVVVLPNEARPPKDSENEKRPVRPVVWRPMSLDRREPLEEGDTHRVMDMDRPW